MTTVDAGTPLELIKAVYSKYGATTAIARQRLGRPVTLTEKILFAHLANPDTQEVVPGKSYLDLMPDRVAMQDATAQMALLQFMTAGLPNVQVPATVHCDHLIQARVDGKTDLAVAESSNSEVYTFLETVSAKYGVGFWKPGSGIIHQVVLEQYAFPGGMMIGTDSHTPNAGGLGMIAIGVGGADAVDVLVGLPFNLRAPKLIGVRLTGKLSGWSAPKDVILRVADILTVKGGTGAILEYFGPGAATISATGKATICNMGAEIGATTSVFGCDDKTIAYLRATGRDAIADLALANAEHLQADPEVDVDPSGYFDQVIEIDLSTLKPLINGPATPDLSRPVDQLGADAIANDWPIQISAALIGSCTNSSYEDITRTASIARQAAAAGLRVKTDLLVTPGSERVRATIERDGLLADLEAIGATVLANACGPCIGQWQRDDLAAGTPNVIVTSYNRNFPKRNDGRSETLAFVTSPETVMAYALVGRLDFDPTTDAIDGIKLDEPVGIELPSNGFVDGDQGFAAPSANGDAITVVVSPGSDRLQLLTAFEPWDGEDFVGLPILAKAIGKCTTDHISPAGPWLKYRGHLENISMNLFSGAINAYTGEAGFGADVLDSMAKKSFPEIARDWSRAGQPWVFVADENYGEGSSREHAAMEPRFRGARAIIARSFARIAETNLKKQGVLPLFFEDRDTYDLINVDTRISILGLQDLTPDVPLNCELLQSDGTVVAFRCTHTFSPDQIDWFRAGGALNLIRQQFAS